MQCGLSPSCQQLISSKSHGLSSQLSSHVAGNGQAKYTRLLGFSDIGPSAAMVHAPMPLAVGAMMEVKHEAGARLCSQSGSGGEDVARERLPLGAQGRQDQGALRGLGGRRGAFPSIYPTGRSAMRWIFAESDSGQGWLSAQSAVLSEDGRGERNSKNLLVAKRGWLPRQAEHLRIRKGDKFYLEKEEAGWIYGQLTSGLARSSYKELSSFEVHVAGLRRRCSESLRCPKDLCQEAGGPELGIVGTEGMQEHLGELQTRSGGHFWWGSAPPTWPGTMC